MRQRVRVIGTGIHVDEHPDPERALADVAARLGDRLSPETRLDIARWRAGEVAFVRLTPFAEFDDGSGPRRWDGTPQGPYAVPLTQSATSTLLSRVEMVPSDLLAELGISDMNVSRFAFRAAPRRIDVEPNLAEILVLD
jgi:hypothetical protein